MLAQLQRRCECASVRALEQASLPRGQPSMRGYSVVYGGMTLMAASHWSRSCAEAAESTAEALPLRCANGDEAGVMYGVMEQWHLFL